MSYCVNPKCPYPSDPKNTNQLFCVNCGLELILQQRYRLIQPLGKGGCGEVFEIDDRGTPKVLKRLNQKSAKIISLFKQEAKVLSRLQHPGIPKVEKDGYFQYQLEGSLNPIHCLVMEKIEGLNLAEWMRNRENKPIGEAEAIPWLWQLIDILEKLHQNQYFHRDIKPSNIMLKPDGQLVLIDFGTIREITDTYLAKIGTNKELTSVHTYGYTPAEQINGKPLPQSDFFALGRTFVYLLTGKEPDEFEENNESKILWQDSAMHVCKLLIDLIDWLIEPLPRKRPPHTEAIRQCLNELQAGNLNYSLPKIEDFDRKNDIFEEPLIATTIYQKPRWRGWQMVIFASTLATSLVMGVRYFGWLERSELVAFDRLMQMRPAEKQDARFLIVTLDEKDRQYQDEKKWDRQESLSNEALELLLHKLTPHQPRIIGLNIFRPSGFDRKLASVVEKNSKFIVSCAGDDPKNIGTPSIPNMPAERLGFTDLVKDPDSVIRRQLLTMDADPSCNTTVSFNLRVAESYLGRKVDLKKIKAKKLTYNVGGYQLPPPEAAGYQILINYRYPDFKPVKLREILDGSMDAQLSAMVSDRIVLIGADIRSNSLTPYRTAKWPKPIPEVVIHAQMINQLISADLDHRPLLWWWNELEETIWIWSWSLVGGIIGWQFRSRIYLVVALTLTISIVAALCFISLLFAGWIPLIPSILALLIAVASLGVYNSSKNH